MDADGGVVEIKRDRLSQCKEYNFRGWTEEMFRQYVSLLLFSSLCVG